MTKRARFMVCSVHTEYISEELCLILSAWKIEGTKQRFVEQKIFRIAMGELNELVKIPWIMGALEAHFSPMPIEPEACKLSSYVQKDSADWTTPVTHT